MSTSKWTTFSYRFHLLGLNSQFCPPIFSQWLGKQIFLDNLSSFDPDLYNGLVFFKALYRGPRRSVIEFHYGDVDWGRRKYLECLRIGRLMSAIQSVDDRAEGIEVRPSGRHCLTLFQGTGARSWDSNSGSSSWSLASSFPLRLNVFIFMNICNMNTVFLLSKYHGR